ncbi:MAG: hypothetical protein M3150_03940 [Pseudomonadota bacterium]|nr:hypothetical protein [Pseudomonadota bacterium]
MTPLHRLSSGHALATLLIVLALAGSWLHPLEAAADRQIDAGLKRALVSFATARALDAVISVAQGTAVSVQPFGVGVNLTIGQVLDPVHQVIGQFASLMLIASVAFGVQKVLLAMGAHWGVSLVLTGAGLAWVALSLRRGRAVPWVTRLLIVMLMVRFAIPVVTLGSDLVFEQFLASDYLSSQRLLDRTATEVQVASPAAGTAAGNEGLLDRVKSWAGSQSAAWKERFEGIKRTAEQATDHVIKLMVIFMLQTLIMPVALLWLLLAFARAAMRRTRRP